MVAFTGTLMLLAARMAFSAGEVNAIPGDRGILFSSANLWLSDPWTSMALNTALILGTALSWMLVVQVFNPFRALTTLQASFFLIMWVAVPDLMDQLNSGTLLAASVVVCTALLWSAFGDPARTRRIFLLFTLLSSLAMTQYCFVFFIPAYILGCVQMKIFNGRTITAAALGIITPWWIVLGLGIRTFADVHLPVAHDFFTSLSTSDTLLIALTALLTVAILVLCWATNVMRIITLNANLRAFNGNITILALTAILAMIADFTNAAAYLPTLFLMAAYQAGCTLATHRGRHSYAAVGAIVLAYVAIFAYQYLGL